MNGLIADPVLFCSDVEERSKLIPVKWDRDKFESISGNQTHNVADSLIHRKVGKRVSTESLGVATQTSNLKRITMESLILAQDER
jgi:hypothetical protein